MNSTANDTAPIIRFLHDAQAASYVNIANCVLFIYDYLITWDLEYSYVWRRKKTFVSFLFFACRYSPFLDITLGLRQQFILPPSVKECHIIFTIIPYFVLAGVSSGDALLVFRTSAIWNHNVKMIVILVLMYSATFVAVGFCLHDFVGGIDYVGSPVPHCINVSKSTDMAVACILITIFETVILCVTIAKVFQTQKGLLAHHGKSVMTVVLRDGMAFYFYILAVSIVTAVLFVRPMDSSTNVAAVTHRVLHSILASRLVFNLRHALGKVNNNSISRAIQIPTAIQDSPSCGAQT